MIFFTEQLKTSEFYFLFFKIIFKNSQSNNFLIIFFIFINKKIKKLFLKIIPNRPYIILFILTVKIFEIKIFIILYKLLHHQIIYNNLYII